MPQQKEKRERILNDSWLLAYKNYIIRQESPDVFHFWVGMTLVLAAMRRNVFIDRGAYKVFPNQYVFLVAKSGLCKKSAAMDIGLDLIRKIEGITAVHGRATVEGLIDLMNKFSLDPKGKIKPDGSVLIHADELSYLFGKASYITDLITFFTSAYTSKARLDFLTRNKGRAEVKNPCPTILAGTTPEQMGDIFPSLVLASGFMARVVLVWGDEVERVAKPEINHAMEDTLIHDLGCIADLCGEMKLTEEAENFFDRWYEEMLPPADLEFIAFYQRKHDHVLKTAMAISAAESDYMQITLTHLHAAIGAIEYVEEKLPDALASIGSTAQSHLGEQIFGIIKANHPKLTAHSTLMRRVYKRLNYGAPEFQGIIDGLKEAKRIKEEASVGSKGIYYTLF